MQLGVQIKGLDASDPEQIRAGVLGLAAISLAQMQRRPLPNLYTSGIRYQREPIGREWFQTAAFTARVKHGDCEDLAAYRLAELWYRHHRDATIGVKIVRPELIHILVLRDNGRLVEDPSRVLGMGRAA